MEESVAVQEETPAPVEQPAESTPATEETPADTAAQPEEEKKPVVPPGLQKRIDQLTREKHEARREAEYLRQLALQQPKPQEPPQTAQKPTREQYDYDEDRYLDALAEHKVQQKLNEQYQAQERQRQEQQAVQQRREYTEQVNKTILHGESKYADFDEVVVESGVPITDVMAGSMSLEENGHDVAYYLGKNPDEAARIANLPVHMQMREVIKLAAKLATPVVKKPTSAPAPIEPVGARGQVETDPDKMDVNEWRKWREAQLKRK